MFGSVYMTPVRIVVTYSNLFLKLSIFICFLSLGGSINIETCWLLWSIIYSLHISNSRALYVLLYLRSWSTMCRYWIHARISSQLLLEVVLEVYYTFAHEHNFGLHIIQSWTVKRRRSRLPTTCLFDWAVHYKSRTDPVTHLCYLRCFYTKRRNFCRGEQKFYDVN